MFIDRIISKRIQDGAKQMPVIALIGPRQSGKSTLARHVFPEHIYLDMQDADLFAFANEDPKGFLQTYKNERGIIIDEAQYAPALFPQIKVEADKYPQPGYFVLSGSQNFLLLEKITESLAGRVYFYTLLPLSISELSNANLLLDSPEQQMSKGFYPRVYLPEVNPYEYYENYIATYVERDIRSIRNLDNILVFKKFMQLCALRVGNVLNVADLASSCGITEITAKNWLNLLETSFILFLLPSYHNNLSKRVIKSPKLFFYDVGLAATLAKRSLQTIADDRALYGALFENMIIVDLIKNFNTHTIRPQLTFFRDNNRREVDLVIELGGKIIPIEIKASQTTTAHFFDTLAWFNQLHDNQRDAVVVYAGKQDQKRSKGSVVGWQHVDKVVGQLYE